MNLQTQSDFNFFNIDVYNNTLRLISKEDEWKDVFFFGLFFTSSWCPPCKEFEGKLRDFYKEVNSKSDNRKVFEVIQINSEKSSADFELAIKNIEWGFLNYTDKTIQSLVDEYNIIHIPCLLIFNNDSQFLVEEGRVDITNLSSKEVWEKWMAKNMEKESNL